VHLIGADSPGRNHALQNGAFCGSVPPALDRRVDPDAGLLAPTPDLGIVGVVADPVDQGLRPDLHIAVGHILWSEQELQGPGGVRPREGRDEIRLSVRRQLVQQLIGDTLEHPRPPRLKLLDAQHPVTRLPLARVGLAVGAKHAEPNRARHQ
jgi:hypothetical protein